MIPTLCPRWTHYGRWSDDGKTCFSTNKSVRKFCTAPVIFKSS